MSFLTLSGYTAPYKTNGVPCDLYAIVYMIGVDGMRLPSTEHTKRPWLIHEIAPDFRLEGVWALPTPGGPDGFSTLIAVLDEADFEQDAPRPARALWALRWKLGAVLRLDRPRTGLNTRVTSLRDRLSPDLRAAATAHTDDPKSLFTFLYQLPDEYAAEIANRTVHAVLHLSWVPDGQGGWRGQMAVLVKPNGHLGAAYMALIKPFRHLIIYPAIMRSWERRWEYHWEHDRTAPSSPVPPTTVEPVSPTSPTTPPH